MPTRSVFAASLVGALALWLAGPAQANPCNPCAAKAANPCGNPCAAKAANPCGANPCNPCGGGRVDPGRFQKPEGLRLGGDRARLLARGAELWQDTGLSSNGAACASCHAGNAQFLPSFARAYPHEVAMVKAMSGVGAIEAAEMVQFCMIQPMQAEPLPWNSVELAALTAYVEDLQQGFTPNPCAAKSANPCNPCAAKGSNPCNPCSAKGANPCNPCAGKGANPCNPCAR